MSLDTELTHMKNIKSKETTALIVNGKTLKLEDNVGGNLDDLGNKDDCLDTTLKTWSMKEIFDKLDFTEIKHFFPMKDVVERMTKQAHKLRENICKRHV